jgi:hypothetical protein
LTRVLFVIEMLVAIDIVTRVVLSRAPSSEG